MKITHVIPALTKGGAERVLVELANQFAAGGHEVTVVAAYPVDETLTRNSLLPGVRMIYISASGRPRLKRYFVLLPWLWRNRRWILDQDVVHCHLTFASVAGTAVRWLRRMSCRGPRVVETFHAVGMPIPKSTQRLFGLMAVRRDGCALMAEDDFWRRFIQAHPGLPVAIIPNGISMPAALRSEAECRAARAALGVPDGCRWFVGTIGRAVAERNPLAVIAVFADIARRVGPDVHFVMGGDGPMLDEVRQAGERHGISNRLHLPGLVTDPPALLAAMDLYVSINVGPITGIAGLEAAAAGLPVIALQALPAHRLGAADWIWSDPDPGKVGEHGAELLLDRTSRHALSARQQRHVRDHLSSEAMAAAYAALYAAAGAPDVSPLEGPSATDIRGLPGA